MYKAYLVVVVQLIAVLAIRAEETGKRNEKDSTKVKVSPAFSEVVKSEYVEEKDKPIISVQSARGQTSDPAMDLWHRSTLTGDWNGAREDLRGSGVSFSLGYKADNLANVSGGLSQSSSYLHNIDVIIGLDAERLFHWKGASFLVHAISNNGGGFSTYVGDLQRVSNIEAPQMTKLYKALYQQNFMHDRLSFAVGLYDLKSEFYVTRSALVFLNNSFGVGKEVSQTGQSGPAIFPNSAASFRVRMQPSAVWSFQFAAIDAVPGKVDQPTSPAITLSTNEGALVIGEVSYTWAGNDEESIGAGKYTLGAWLYTSSFDETYAAKSSRSTANNGVYVMAEQNVYKERSKPEEGLSLFTRLGFANGRINRFNYHVTCGAVYTGLLPGREQDRFGLAFANVNNGTEFQDKMLAAGTLVAGGELALELTYHAQLAPWLSAQTDVQYIVHPGAQNNTENATTFGTRIEVGL